MIGVILALEAVALVIGYLARPVIDDLRSERRHRRHVVSCPVCSKVAASNGPLFLYCGEGRGNVLSRETADDFEARTRRGLRDSDGVPREVRDAN